MEPFEYRHRVLFDDTTLAGDVYFARFLSWQGRCRELFLLDHAPAVIHRLRDGLALVTTRCSCDYLAEAVVGDEIAVRMRLGGLTHNLIDLDFEYRRVGDGVLLARGAQQVACMRRAEAGIVPEPVPAPLARALEPYQARAGVR